MCFLLNAVVLEIFLVGLELVVLRRNVLFVIVVVVLILSSVIWLVMFFIILLVKFFLFCMDCIFFKVELKISSRVAFVRFLVFFRITLVGL